MSTWITNNFDIDLWIKLAAEHPFKFETQRQQWLEHSILHANPESQPRLRGIQWEIEMDLSIAKNKFRPCKQISRRIVDNLMLFKDILAGQYHVNFAPAKSAQILEFTPART